MMRRKSSLAAAQKFAAQLADEAPEITSKRPLRKPTRAPISEDPSASEHEPSDGDAEADDAVPEEPAPKRQKRIAPSKGATQALHKSLFDGVKLPSSDVAHGPTRPHTAAYHRPLLLSGPSAKEARQALLTWFDSVSTTRRMPWRKAWIDPASHQDSSSLRQALERRAYEVWISEIMLQQTRVAVVIDYWNRWMAKWPTIQDLAQAHPDEVLSAWRGLGYYSRATRIHEAAKLVVADAGMGGLLPSNVTNLEKNVPGVGRYTAGAICAIVFGKAAPMVDGNVLRVLSRQLGVLGNVKSDKPTIDLMWAAADALVKAVAKDGLPDGPVPSDEPLSDRPGRWGQALMELGSTVCTPKPNCGECPVSSTCRAYAEGESIARKAKTVKKQVVADIEDACTMCHPLEEAADEAPPPSKAPKVSKAKQATLAAFRFTRKANAEDEIPAASSKPTAKELEVIVDHARKFPLKIVKKAVREEETVVCAIRHGDRFLLHRRPEKGLLAGLWEFPSKTVPLASKKPLQKKLAVAHVGELGAGDVQATHAGTLGSVPWLFSHIKLTMHVHLFELPDDCPGVFESTATERWATVDEVEDESMGTGMRKCWEMVREAAV
jgi:A/G-specific adenine glycosylase